MFQLNFVYIRNKFLKYVINVFKKNVYQDKRILIKCVFIILRVKCSTFLNNIFSSCSALQNKVNWSEDDFSL